MLCRVHKPFTPTAMPLLEMLGDIRSVDYISAERDVVVVDVKLLGDDDPMGYGFLEVSIDRDAKSATIRLVPC